MTEPVGLGKELGQRTGGVMVAEGAGIVTSLGALLLVKKLAGPERMAAAKEEVAMHVVLPILNRVDATVGKFQDMRAKYAKGGKDDTADITQDSATELVGKASNASGATPSKAVKEAADVFRSEKMTPEQKARKYADTLLDFSIMMPVGILTRIWAQDRADRAFGATPLPTKHYLYAKVPDMVANNVALVAMNTVAKAPSQAVSSTVEKLLGSVGVEQPTAKSMATYLTYVQGSNFIGNMANVGYVTAMSRKQQQMDGDGGVTR